MKKDFSRYVVANWRQIQAESQRLAKELISEYCHHYPGLDPRWIERVIRSAVSRVVDMIYLMPNTSLSRSRHRNLANHLSIMQALVKINSGSIGPVELSHPIIRDVFAMSAYQHCQALQGTLLGIIGVKEHEHCLQQSTRACVQRVVKVALEDTSMNFDLQITEGGHDHLVDELREAVSSEQAVIPLAHAQHFEAPVGTAGRGASEVTSTNQEAAAEVKSPST